MTQHESPTTASVRHDGWTPARRTQFLEALSHNGNVLAACARVGMSREAAYRLRRREPAFARAWAAAQMTAREASAEALGCRALDGIEEEVWYRGEFKGTRRRFDCRLLLAHMARLDKLAEANEQAVADAERFDELVALACGAEPPEELAMMDGLLPCNREDCAMAAADCAAEEWSDAHEMPDLEPIEDEDPLERADRETEAWRAAQDERNEACREARLDAAAQWEAWFAGACETVDRLLAESLDGPEADPGTPSELSTSTPAPEAEPEPDTPSELSTSPVHDSPFGPYASGAATCRYARA